MGIADALGMGGNKAEKEAKATLLSKIEGLASGQSLNYKLAGEVMGGALAIVELNTSGKGKKYMLCGEKYVNGQRSGKKYEIFSSDKSKDIADWIASRGGSPLNS